MGLGYDVLRQGRLLAGRAYNGADRAIDAGQVQAMRFLWLFLPETSIAREARFQQLLVSRLFSDIGQQSLSYAALVSIAIRGGSAFDLALIGAAAITPPALLGLYGGAVADELPKRIALAMVYNLQALLCFVSPWLFGTDLFSMMLLVFAVNTLGQVSGPTEQSVLPHVATNDQLASAASLIGFASAVGTAFGTALLAPILLRLFGVTVVLYAAGVFLLMAATRVFDLRAGDNHHFRPRTVDWTPRVRVRETLRWLAQEPAIATMVFVSVLAGTAQIVMQTLAPRYVQAAVGVDASNAVYVFATSSIGLVAALYAMPRMVMAWGERNTTLLGFACLTLSLLALGAIEVVAPVLDPFNPARLLNLADLDLSAKLRTASFLAIPLGFGVSLSTTSVQTYLNRRVPHHLQGRVFALKSTIKHATAIVPLTMLGLASEAFGVERVLTAAPFLLLAAAYALIQLSRHYGGHSPRRGLDVLATYWQEPKEMAAV
jgi:predicted MFS family arabinose efflux permease